MHMVGPTQMYKLPDHACKRIEMQVGLERSSPQSSHSSFNAEDIRVLSSLTDETHIQKVGLLGRLAKLQPK